jgi:hypothetical protein
MLPKVGYFIWFAACQTFSYSVNIIYLLKVLRKTGEAYAFCIVSQNIVRMIKSRRTRLVGHVAHTGEMRNAYSILVGKPEETRPSKRPRC